MVCRWVSRALLLANTEIIYFLIYTGIDYTKSFTKTNWIDP
jgi:hypothetical protein